MVRDLSDIPCRSVVHILVADDEAPIRHLIVKTLSRAGWEYIDTAKNGLEALEKLAQGHFELCILDLRMPFMDGLEVIERARRQGTETDIVVLTGYGTIEGAVEAMKLGAQDFLTKPIQMEKLTNVVSQLLRKHQSTPHVVAEKMDAFLIRYAVQPSLKVEDLCRHFHISSRYVSLLFRTHIGASFPQRLAFHRVQQAKPLMRTTELPLNAIASACGFGDYRRLHEAFSALEGMSPGQYRKIAAE